MSRHRTTITRRSAILGTTSGIVGTAASVFAASLFIAPAAQAQDDRLLQPPPGMTILRNTPGVLPGEAALDLAIRYTDGLIYNPATGQDEAVRLRAYRDMRDTDVAPTDEALFVGPTIDVTPGETVRVTLHNELPETEQSCPDDIADINVPHCFNRTNLHSHGLWISPTGNSDNVLIAIDPGVSFQYEWNIPADHPSGTFWYHPHLHGSTALQVSSGMAGFIVIRGDRLPTPAINGDVDTLLAGADVEERLLLLQQIQYACYDEQGRLETFPDGTYRCDPGQTGVIENYDQFSPGDWAASGRYTTINGEVLPIFPDAVAGRLERWRVAHAGIRDTVSLSFRKARSDVATFSEAAADEADGWITQNCPGEPIPAFALAEDGLTRAALDERTVSVLQPGYRTDLVVVFPEEGSYCIIDDAATATTTVSGGVESRRYLGSVEVGAGDTVPTDALAAYVTEALVGAAERTMPDDVRTTVVTDLQNGMKLSAFVPHATIAADEVTGTQSLAFSIDVTTTPTGFLVDGEAYDADRIDRTLVLGGVDEWTLTSGTDPAAGHPFHIHVNPFQVVEILDPSGVDVSVDGEADDPQYAGLKGVWKDTLFVKPGYDVVVRTRYQRYIGEFVLHCHILDHEDQGMMQNVSIVLPNATGAVSRGVHGAH